MPTIESEKHHEDIEKLQRETLVAVIREQVLHALGEPERLRAVQVRRLWKHHYRVNVLVGEIAALAKIANSFFVKADEDGSIIKAVPLITKQY